MHDATVTITITSEAARTILMFHYFSSNSSHTKSRECKCLEERREPKRNRTEVLLLTSLTARPHRLAMLQAA